MLHKNLSRCIVVGYMPSIKYMCFLYKIYFFFSKAQMIPNLLNACCKSEYLDESRIQFEMPRKNQNQATVLFKNIPKPFKESQISSYTQKLSIAKKLKKKKVQNSFQNNTNKVLFNKQQRNEEKNSNYNQSTRIQQQQQSAFSNFLNRLQESEKSLYEELMSPRTIIQSQILNKKQFK